MTSFEMYTVEIGIVAGQGGGDAAASSLRTRTEPVPEGVLSEWWARTERFFEVRNSSDFDYAVREAVEAAAERAGWPAAIWRADFKESGAIFGDREALAAFLRKKVFEKAIDLKPIRYLLSWDSAGEPDLIADLEEPPSKEELANRMAEIESAAQELERLRPGPLYAIVVRRF